jgi:hypothetical protein
MVSEQKDNDMVCNGLSKIQRNVGRRDFAHSGPPCQLQYSLLLLLQHFLRTLLSMPLATHIMELAHLLHEEVTAAVEHGKLKEDLLEDPPMPGTKFRLDEIVSIVKEVVALVKRAHGDPAHISRKK